MNEETGLSICYMGILLVKHGQMDKSDAFGLENGVCLEKNPNCGLCGISKYCEKSEFL